MNRLVRPGPIASETLSADGKNATSAYRLYTSRGDPQPHGVAWPTSRFSRVATVCSEGFPARLGRAGIEISRLIQAGLRVGQSSGFFRRRESKREKSLSVE